MPPPAALAATTASLTAGASLVTPSPAAPKSRTSNTCATLAASAGPASAGPAAAVALAATRSFRIGRPNRARGHGEAGCSSGVADVVRHDRERGAAPDKH